MSPDPVLVTGAAGFIAHHLIGAIRASHPTQVIIGLDSRAGIDSRCDFAVRADIRSSNLVRAVDVHRIGNVYHLAALAKEPGYSWREYFETNAYGTKRLLAAMDEWQTRHLVFTSTMMVHAAGPWRRSEIDFEDPDTAYGMSKLQAEESLRAWAAADKTRRLRIVRPGVVFGPGDEGNVARLIVALHRRRFGYIGRQTTVKGCIYVKDLADLLLNLSRPAAPEGVIHAVYPTATTIAMIVAAICEAWQIRRKPLVVPYALALGLAMPFMLLDPHGRRLTIHPRRIQKLYRDTNLSADRLAEVPWTPRYSLVDAFKDWRSDLHGAIPAD